MDAPVIVTPQALEDLREIVAYIVRDNAERAKTFGDTLLFKALRLGEQPMIGRMVRENRDPAVREVIHGSYRIVYRLRKKPVRVFVICFWHGARGTPEIVED